MAALTLPAAAQDVVDRALLEHCATLGSTEDKLACFESLVHDAKSETIANHSSAADAGASTQPAAQPMPVVQEATREATQEVNQELIQETPLASLPDEVGLEHLDRGHAKEVEEPEAMAAVVKSVQKKGNRLLYFEFDNGQIWRQMESGYFPYPRQGQFDVTIRQGVMGDYQLRVEDRGRMLRIVRVK